MLSREIKRSRKQGANLVAGAVRSIGPEMGHFLHGDAEWADAFLSGRRGTGR